MAWLCSDGALQILLALICAIFSGYTVLMYDVWNFLEGSICPVYREDSNRILLYMCAYKLAYMLWL